MSKPKYKVQAILCSLSEAIVGPDRDVLGRDDVVLVAQQGHEEDAPANSRPLVGVCHKRKHAGHEHVRCRRSRVLANPVRGCAESRRPTPMVHEKHGGGEAARKLVQRDHRAPRCSEEPALRARA